MSQREKISNNFSDAYLLGILEGNAQEVLTHYSKDFPELAAEFKAHAESLDLLYGDIGQSAKPSDTEIGLAYKKISERLAPQEEARKSVATEPGFLASLKAFFSGSPMWAGASLGIGVAVIIALLWQPWVIKESIETAHEGTHNEQTTSENSKENLAFEDQKHTSPTDMPEVQYRGHKSEDKLTAQQKAQQNANDAANLKKLQEKELTAVEGLQVQSTSAHEVLISWNPEPNALSYIVMMREENDDTFDPVTQISKTQTRVTSLQSGKKYFVKVIAVRGERMGPSSEVKSIVVQ